MRKISKAKKNQKTNFVPQYFAEICLTGSTMASPYQVKYLASEKQISVISPETIKDNIEKIFLEINRQMSIYVEGLLKYGNR